MPSTPVPPFDDAPTGAPAYCLYTSGSTGAPKGVLVSYGALAAHVQAVADAFAVTARDRVLQFSAFSFDTSIEQFMVAWSAGAGVVMREDAPWSADELFDRVREQAVTIADIPVSYWHLLAARFEREAVDAPLRMLVVGGEAVVAGPHGAPGQTLPRALNAYGPTETTITCTLGDLHDVRGRSGPYVPIGRPLPGTRVFVLDDRLRPVPRGVAGEVFVAGSRVALGYLRRPGLTAERFLPCPFGAPGERMYRSGDLGRWLPDGRLEFLGRRDFQVKLGGVRIELGEIEQVLLRHQGVRDAAAMLAGSSDAPFLAACVVLRDGSGDLREVRAFAAEELAEAMRPARWLVLPALPLTAQGKVDRAALARDVAESATRSAAAPPSAAAPSPTLSRLLELLARLAPAPVCDPDMPLVDAGLHSLLMLRLVAQCGDVFGVALKPRELLKAGSARRIAALIDRLLPGGSSA
jgi:amino acid adenylation domain-containing protein